MKRDTEKPPERRSAATGDPFPEFIRRCRQERGLTQAQLAKLAGVRSTAYVNMIEKGLRVPDPEVAEGLARALLQDPGLFRDWVVARKGHSDLGQTSRSWLRLAEFFRAMGHPVVDGLQASASPHLQPRAAMERDASPRAARASQQSALFLRSLEPAPGELRVPVLPEGEDPGDDREPAFEPIDWINLGHVVTAMAGPEELEILRRLDQPFAYVLTDSSVRFAPDLLRPRLVAIVSRAWTQPLSPREVYAVRHRGRVHLMPGSLLLADEQVLEAGELAADLRALGVRALADLRRGVIGMLEIEAQPASLRRVGRDEDAG